MNLEQLKSKIIRKIDLSWPKIYIIRFVYLELGKYLSKDTDFYFSVDKKLDDLNLSYDEIMDIYNSSTGRDNKVVCRSASLILKSIFDSLGIKSYLVKSLNNYTELDNNGEKEYLNHWILVVNDDYNNYFLSLASDLAYIQEGFKTKHFASNIEYLQTLKDGSTVQVYEGEEIKHKVLSDDILRKIDLNIGYLNETNNYEYENYNFNKLKAILKNNKLYYRIISHNTNFYKELYIFKSNGKKISFSDTYLSDLTIDDINNWIYNLCKKISLKIDNLTNYKNSFNNFNRDNFNYDIWLSEMCNNINNYYSLNIDNTSYSKWSREIKKNVETNPFAYDDIISIMDNTHALVSIITGKANGNFNELLTKLAFNYVDKKYIYDKDNKYASSIYINHKFNILFPFLMSSNELIQSFNYNDYAEQNVIIKELIEMMFPEVSSVKNDGYAALFNRLQLYTIKNKKTLEYAIIFNVIGDKTIGDQYYFYDSKKNIFRITNILDLYSDYVMVSDRLKSKLDVMDEINSNIKSRG